MLEPARSKKARVQTLLRVIYDMPLDKAEVLAKFLNDNVKGEIEARTEKEALVVTAEVGIQRTVAGIVSLMTGEPVALDLGGNLPTSLTATLNPVYHDPNSRHPPVTTYLTPTLTEQPVVPSTVTARPTERRELRPRTVFETDPATGKQVPRTVLEERVLETLDEPAKSGDPSATQPRTYFTPASPSEPPKTPPTSNVDPAIGP
jgi:hypothetical protein